MTRRGATTSFDGTKAVARRFIEHVWNAGDLDAADIWVHPGYAVPSVGGGPEGVRRNVVTFREAFPDREWTIEGMVAAGDRAGGRMTLRAPSAGCSRVSRRPTSA